MTPIELSPRQLQLALKGEELEVLAPITPGPEQLQEADSNDGTWRHARVAVLCDDLTLPHVLERYATPVVEGDVLYAVEPFHLTGNAQKGINITYLIAPAQQLNNPPLPERVRRGALSALTHQPKAPMSNGSRID